jgi:ubiquinol-cytochrome c reductase iron-sulfur subunit
MAAPASLGRRQLLVRAAGVTGMLGVASAAYPFIRSWQPSARAMELGGPVEVDLAALESGAMLKVLWQGKPVYIVRRPAGLLNQLQQHMTQLVDPASEKSTQPEYARNATRSRVPEYLVVLGVCTHLQCAPAGVFSGPSPRPDLLTTWPGGFFCACHGSVYDAAGRVFKNVPAPTNLPIPPHYFVSPRRLVIGLSQAATA